jgi:hypothetical protein
MSLAPHPFDLYVCTVLVGVGLLVVALGLEFTLSSATSCSSATSSSLGNGQACPIFTANWPFLSLFSSGLLLLAVGTGGVLYHGIRGRVPVRRAANR